MIAYRADMQDRNVFVSPCSFKRRDMLIGILLKKKIVDPKLDLDNQATKIISDITLTMSFARI